MNQQEKELLKQFNISMDDLTHHFGFQTISRGVDYFRNGNAFDIEEVYENDMGGLSVNGMVSGSGRKVYDTSINLTPMESGLVSVESECSCPVDQDCKHGIALLFEFIETLQQSDPDYFSQLESPALQETARVKAEEQRVNDWLQVIAESEQAQNTPMNTPVSAKQEAQYHLVYVLDFHSAANGQRVILSPHKVRQLKKGGYGKAMRFNTYDVLEYHSTFRSENFYFETTDSEILRALQTQAQTYAYYSQSPGYYLSGEIGDLVLKKVLRTGRCFWKSQEQNTPLSIGPEVEFHLDWEELGDHVVAKPGFSRPVSHMFQLDTFHYIDEPHYQCGTLAHPGLTPTQLTHFLTAPPIPKQHARAVTEQLLQLFPDSDIPLPEQIDIEEVVIKDKAPLIRLRLHGEVVPGGQRIHIASLAFDYGELVIQPHTEEQYQRPHLVQLEGQTRFRLERERSSEDQARQTLASAGFSSLDPERSPFGVLDMTIYDAANPLEVIEKWDHFTQSHLPVLREAGWQVTIEDSFYLSITTVDDWQAELDSDESGEWFELALGFELDGKRINLLPLLVDLLASASDTAVLREQLQAEEYRLVRVDDYQWVKLPTQRLLRVLDTLLELYDTDTLNSNGNLEFSRHEGMHYGDLLNDAGLQWKGAEELKALHERLQQFQGIESRSLPDKLQATLRDYQQEGYDWMSFMRDYGFNGILADDMGLGKTVQALSLLLNEKEGGQAQHPSLVIAPTSLMSNWRNEAERFTPDLKVLVLQGSDRKQKFDQFDQADIIITTYPLIVRDAEFYQEKHLHYLILDEAQAIKNPRAKSTQTILQLKSQHRLCLTGTPVENHLGELWSMFHFLMPGYLGNLERFNRLFRHPVEKHADTERGKQLQQRVQPFMLRRTKSQVAGELPEKTEIIRTVSLSGKQRDLYETVRLAMDKKVRDEIKKKGLARSHIMILDALLKLRQVCNDPRLVKLDKAKKVNESAKLDMLMEMLPEMVENGNKILLFSQFTSMLGLIEAELKKHKISYSKLTGQTRKRAEAIAAFQEGDAAVFLISLKAGGTGLNLTAADTVIHYDPWWNPAVEQQATDRAYRIGQDKPVFVYKLLTEETVEEKILALQQRKQALADSIYKGGKQEAAFDQADLMELLQPLK